MILPKPNQTKRKPKSIRTRTAWVHALILNGKVESIESSCHPPCIRKDVQSWPSAPPLNGLFHLDRSVATGAIRRQCYDRSGGRCEATKVILGDVERCTTRVTLDSGQLHERMHRGQRDEKGRPGLVSMGNSVFICRDCHDQEHSERRPRLRWVAK